METLKDLILGAVARGWCSKENEHKTMDIDLAKAIAEEVMPAISRTPNLGCATTRELLAEITARIEVDGQLDYRTIDED